MALFFLMFNDLVASMLTYVWVNVVLVFILFITASSWRRKLGVIVTFSLLLPFQIYCVIRVINFLELGVIRSVFALVFAYLLILLSFGLEQLMELWNYENQYYYNPPSTTLLYFSDLAAFKNKLAKGKERLVTSREVMTKENINELMCEFRRNNSFLYINDGSLTEEYFTLLEETLEDESVYIVLSDTGSATSRMISVFTDKPYNHSSIAFDRDLKSLISYNGGERVNPPGLNCEMVSYLQKKEDAVIYVYRLSVTREQKAKMIEKIRLINEKGSAYNMLGLVTKKSVRPNIMYCSQFVYSLLDYAGARYFTKKGADIRPTDLVELDYERKLEFAYRIKI